MPFPITKLKGRPKPWQVNLRRIGQGRKFFKTLDEAKTFASQRETEVRNFGTAALNINDEERLEFLQAKARLAKLGGTHWLVKGFQIKESSP